MDIFQTILRALRRHLTPAARVIFVVNIGVFVAALLAAGAVGWDRRTEYHPFIRWFAEFPDLSILRFQLWRLVTCVFLQLDGFHLLFNMVLLWFFAPEVEAKLGTRRFWQFYLAAGVGSAAIRSLVVGLTPSPDVPALGASGALMGMLFAYACYFPERTVLVWGLIPIRIKFLVAIIIGFDVFMLGSAGDTVSRISHLAGVGVAYIWLTRYYRTPDLRRWRWM